MSALNLKDHDALGEWCLQNNISLVVIGPEDPLAEGIVDALTQKGQSVCSEESVMFGIGNLNEYP